MKFVAPRSALRLALFVILIVVSCIAFFRHSAQPRASVVTFAQPDKMSAAQRCNALYLTMQGDDAVQIDASTYTRKDALAAIKQRMAQRTEHTVYIRAGRDVSMQTVSAFSADVRATADGVTTPWITDRAWQQAQSGCGADILK
ncbi:hypothetical protein [Silvibacterium dinghuense]|uniref:Uncharacterized protein n=1 Tax=Silvibacterium dinghuense TaxID=1560006 RepID=A0A4Q1SJN3_9BACT|nr:hypothetical protein [Silvibacterium dinghuense]RXS97861.1 hypothetical protein ESZ00_08380 [Silvibacterium dinghuense]GGH02569.1 hypothetical protein GCM10011586_17960 [Silvibacterium dinghuense]